MDKLRQEYHDKLNQLDAPIDKEALWGKIASDSQFPKKKKKSRRFLLLWSFLLATLILGSVFMWNKNSSTPDFESRVQKTSSSENPDLAKRNSSSLDAALPERELFKEKVFKDKRVELTLHEAPTTNLESDQEKSIAVDSKEELFISNLYVNNEGDLLSPNLSITKGAGVNQSVNAPKIYAHNAEDIETDISVVENLSLIADKSEFKEIREDQQALSINPLHISELYFLRPLKNMDSPSIVLTKNKKRWNVGLALGIGTHDTKFNIVNPLSDVNLALLRMDNTRALESYSIQLDVNRRVFKNWSLGVGVQATRIYEEYIFNDVETVYFRNGSKDELFYSAEETIDRYHNFHRMHQLDLKIKLARIWELNSWSFSINAGLIYNASFKISGEVTDGSLRKTPVNEDAQYRNKLGLRYFGGLEVSKHLLIGNVFTSLQIETPHELNIETSNYQHQMLPIYLMVGYRKFF